MEQMRKYQKASSTGSLTRGRLHRFSTKSSTKPLDAQGEAERPQRSTKTLFNSTGAATDKTRVETEHDSLLTAMERDLINIDPFHTLPCRLDRPGQDLAHRAKHLFLQSAPDWSSTAFTSTTGLRTGYAYRVGFCSMLSLASYYLDQASGRGPSLETLQWTSATTSCTRRMLSNPVTQAGDEALLGVLLLLANDQFMGGGKHSILHSKALARLFRLRGGIEYLRLPCTMELFINYNLIALGKAQTAYLDHMRPDAEGAAEFKEWKADVDVLILELQNLNTWAKSVHSDSRGERRALFIKVISFLLNSKTVIEENYWAFIVCYLAVMLWEYRYRPRDGENLLRELARRCQLSRPESRLTEVAWILVQGLDGDRHRKWLISRMIKVLHRLSNGLRLKIGRFLLGLVDPRQARDVFLDTTDFENIQKEAFAGLPVSNSTKLG
jgi:hypothetical protein